MRLNTFNLCLFILLSTTAFAQKRVEYYPNGNKSFEGDYIYNWPTLEMDDILIEDSSLLQGRNFIDDMKGLDYYSHLLPDKLFIGSCTFYYTNGKKKMTGEYVNGNKSGTFIAWYNTGEKLFEKTYLNGMADGTWTTWDKKGEVIRTETYKAFPQKKLAEIRHHAFTGGRHTDEEDESEDIPFKMDRYKIDELFGQYRSIYLSGYLNLFGEVEKEFFMRASWDGPFIIYGTHDRRMAYKTIEMYFKNDLPSGTWKVINDSNRVVCEAVFKDGKLKQGKVNGQTFEEIKKHDQEEMATRNNSRASGAVVAVDPGIKPKPVTQANAANQVFAYVEQMPQPDYDLNKFISEHIKYPKKAQADGIEGRVIIRMIVNEDGSLSDIQVVRGIDPACDNEAIRVMESMPNWKPGKQNGKPVKVYFSLPVTFKIETK